MGEEDDINITVRSPYKIFFFATVLVICAVVLVQQQSFLGSQNSIIKTSNSLIKTIHPSTTETSSSTLEKLNKPNSNNQVFEISKIEELSKYTENPWYEKEIDAYTELATALHSPIIDCKNSALTFRCEKQKVETWQDLQIFNRPSVLTLITPSKLKRFAVLIGLTNNDAILHFNGKAQTVSLKKLGKIWSGEFTFIWQPAKSYSGPLTIGDNHPMVNWASKQFATLDNQLSPLAEGQFNSALEQRVKIFQSNHHLEADGVVGLKTLLALNERLGIAKTLSQTTEEN